MLKRLLIILLIFLLASALVYTFLDRQFESESSSYLTAYGNVDIRQVELGFRVEGKVKKMFFEEGDEVKTGQLLAILDREPYLDEVRRAKANVNSANVSLHYDELTLKRRRELVGKGGISQQELENAEAQRDIQYAQWLSAKASLGVAFTRLKDTLLYCPTEGTILTRIREPGTVVEPSVPIYTVSIKSPIWVRAFVNETNLAKIYPGMKAEVYTDTPGKPVYIGQVGFISPVAEFTPKTVETTDLRTDLVYQFRVVISNPDKWLRQGMPVTVKLKATSDQ